MKKLYTILTACLLLAYLGSCQNEELGQNAIGYLRLEVGTDKTTQTRAEDEYNPKQIAVKIVNSAGKTVKETDDCTTWTEAIELPVGTYTIEASSAGFDGKTAGWDKPYYAAKDTVDIKLGTNTSKSITCKLANVLVTVEFSDDFRAAFQSAVVGVSDKSNSDNKVTFEMHQASETGKAYFPVTDLISSLTVSNLKGELHSKKDTITGIKAQENVILRYRIASSGSSNIGVTVDDVTKTYTYTIGVPVTATNILIASANAWSTFAYLTGEVPSFADVFDQSKLEFQYKTADAAEWTKVATDITVEEKDKKFSTCLTGLTPATAYQCRIYYNDGSEEGITSEAVDFTTEMATPLPNGSFEDWYQSSKTWYPVSEADFANNLFWDSGNKGANTLKEVNPTRPEESDTHSGKAVLLASTTAAGQFAAGSLFTGKFGSASILPLGAKLEFGRPYTSRPSQLKGYYKYNPGAVTHTKKDFINEADRDVCSLYIAMTSWAEPFQSSTGENKFVNFNDKAIIAYGELTKEEMSPESMSDYQPFTIDLRYRDLETKPKYILIVCSSSKYGDYFTGSTSSRLLIDELELIFSEPIIDDNYIK